jgi:hypothetical protein
MVRFINITESLEVGKTVGVIRNRGFEDSVMLKIKIIVPELRWTDGTVLLENGLPKFLVGKYLLQIFVHVSIDWNLDLVGLNVGL